MKIKIPHNIETYRCLIDNSFLVLDAKDLLGYCGPARPSVTPGWVYVPEKCWSIPPGAWEEVKEEETRYFLGESGLLYRVQNGKVNFSRNSDGLWVTSSAYDNLQDCIIWLEPIT
jgi:hypothetical protein